MCKKRKILFVDDESRILDGLRRMLRSMRQEWDMVFVVGGQVALDTLADNNFDVIVSDMHMPGMSGKQLLETVRNQYPLMVRMVLSGQFSQETLLHDIGSVHRYLSKPCDLETLKINIAHACSLQTLLSDKKLKLLTSQLESLPCLPSSYKNLMEELESEDASVKIAGKIISQDIGMSVKMLQLINSAYFGIRQRICSVTQAITLLGLDTVKALVLSSKIFSHFDQINIEEFSLTALWDHNLAVSEAAKLIAKAENVPQDIIDKAVIAGMLHDIGKLIFASKVPDEYKKAMSLSAENGIPLFEAEKEIIGATHADVGAYLLGLWGFTDSVVDALTFHHNPRKASQKEFTVLTAVYVANILINKIGLTEEEYDGDAGIDMEYLEELGLVDRLDLWKKSAWKNTLQDISAEEVN